MKIKVIGKQHMEGIGKTSKKPYNFNQLHFVGKDPNVMGIAAQTINVDDVDYPFDTILLDKEYIVEFNQRGYVVEFRLA